MWGLDAGEASTGTIVAMTSYLARYERGEREQVWRELRALSVRALCGLYWEDADGVARAMAVRARHNVELLMERLDAAGFVFRDNSDEGLERPGRVPPTARASEFVDVLGRLMGPVPLTVAAWIREVGDVWLVGDHPLWPESELADPLVVEFEHSAYVDSDVIEYYKNELAEQRGVDGEVVDGGAPQVIFAPDDYHKANISGGAPYGVEIVGPAVDGLCKPVEMYFVDYLNEAFAAGGFPGALVSEGYVEPPVGLREELAEGMLRL